MQEETKMQIRYLQKKIVQCRSYERNGLDRDLKVEIQGIRRNLEMQLDKQRTNQKEDYRETEWNQEKKVIL